MTLRATGELLKEVAEKWWEHQCMRLGAALAFYAMLSLAPLVVVVMAIAGLVFGREAAQGELITQMRELAGGQAAEVIQVLLANAYQEPGNGILATTLGVVLLLIGAAGAFGELQDALNTIWGVRRKSTEGLWGLVRDRFLSFSMVLGVAFLLIVSLVVSAGLAAVGRFVEGLSGGLGPALHVLHLLLSIGLLAVLFAALFRFLPDVRIAWGDVWVGALVTAALFGVGKYLIGLYIGSSAVGSAYGAAGSFAVFFVWMYYSAQIFFFGAEFTRAYADRFGSRVVPRAEAEAVAPEREQAERAQAAEAVRV